jgi:hypothetical protein
MAEVRVRQCMFCQEGLPVDRERNYPENLAFMAHVEGKDSCMQAFRAWRTNMADDFKGD